MLKTGVVSQDAISLIREAERNVCEDVKHSNKLIVIKKYLLDEKEENETRMAALHGLRRIFLFSLENGKLKAAGTSSSSSAQVKEYQAWLLAQYLSFCNTLCDLVVNENTFFQAAATRSLMELIKKDQHRTGTADKSKSAFPYQIFRPLISAIAYSPIELDIDFMIMLKDEVCISLRNRSNMICPW
jgi:hypothetical protein